MVLLNKTNVFGTGQNGDVKMLMNIQGQTSDGSLGYDYKNWIYPTDQ